MIKFKGLENIDKKLDKLVDKEVIASSMGTACALVEREAKINAPKDTGALRRSITSKVESDGEDVVGVVFTPLEYAPYVEYGTGLFAEEQGRSDVPWHYQDDAGNWHTTSGQHPHPFMRPALDDNRDEIINILREGFMK